MGNDWVYYSTGSYYTGVVDLFGEYYLPCPLIQPTPCSGKIPLPDIALPLL